MAAPAPLSKRDLLLARQIAGTERDLLRVVGDGRRQIEAKIIRLARSGRFGASARVRSGIYSDLSQFYLRLQGKLDGWTQDSIKAVAREWYDLGIDDLKLTDADRRVVTWTKFSERRLGEYFERVHPFNAEKLAAVNVHLNPQLNKMLDTDVRALQRAVVDVHREGMVQTWTAEERRRELEKRVLAYAENPESWAFIDRSGRRWTRENYFNMLNRTVDANVARDAYQDTLVEGGRDTVRIAGGLSENSREACRKWVGKIVSLTGATQGLPTLSEYTDEGGFGPNCVHYIVYVSPYTSRGRAAIEQAGGKLPPLRGKK